MFQNLLVFLVDQGSPLAESVLDPPGISNALGFGIVGSDLLTGLDVRGVLGLLDPGSGRNLDDRGRLVLGKLKSRSSEFGHQLGVLLGERKDDLGGRGVHRGK